MKITLTLSDTEVKLLENDLLDIKDWFERAKDGKINNCKKRFIREWQQKLMEDPGVDSIPTNEEDFIELVTSRPDYENRLQRDEREEKEREALRNQ